MGGLSGPVQSAPGAAGGMPGAPEALSVASLKIAGDIPDVLGDHLARCLFSKSWQLRESALQQLQEVLQGQVCTAPCPGR